MITKKATIMIVASILSAVIMLYLFAQALCRPSEYSLLEEETICRPSRCFTSLRKYSVGRQSTRCWRRKQSVGRHDAFSVRESTLSAVRVLFAGEGNTLPAVTLLYPNAQAFRRPSQCFMQKEEALCRPTECFLKYRLGIADKENRHDRSHAYCLYKVVENY